MMKRMFAVLVPCMLVFILCSGCTGELKSKTVIISDANESTESNLFNEYFEVNKIYKLINNDLRSETLGWVDHNHVLKLSGERETKLELVNYKNNARQNLQYVEALSAETELSPDGRYTFSIYVDNRTTQLKLFNLQNEEEKVIEEFDTAQTTVSGVGWSNNSRYVSYAKTEVGRQKTSIIVYDVELNRMNRYDLAEPNGRYQRISSIQVSDHGEHALLVFWEADQSVVVYGTLEGTAYTNQYEFPISIAEQVDFVNEDQIMFIDQNGSLTIFDQRNATSKILLNKVGIFQLSQDRKSIAYSQEREDIFAATLQGNHMMNNTLIYKGMFPYQMKWSPDDQKLLITGWNLYPAEARIAQDPAEIIDQAPYPAEPINQVPFIIEFK